MKNFQILLHDQVQLESCVALKHSLILLYLPTFKAVISKLMIFDIYSFLKIDLEFVFHNVRNKGSVNISLKANSGRSASR